MEKATVKRNYLYFTLLLLKKKTSEEGEHLTAEDIASYFKDAYGLEPNRKTIYQAIFDLQEMGFDIHLQKEKKNPGYYLGKREINEDEFALLIDGVESIDNIKADEKVEIYEKLCDVLGYPFDEIDSYLYEKRNGNNESIDIPSNPDLLNSDVGRLLNSPSPMDCIKAINRAIKANKQIHVAGFFTDLHRLLLEEIPGDDMGPTEYDFSPYKLLRNSNDEIFLLFYMTYLGKLRVGFAPITWFPQIEMTDKDREPLEDEGLFPEDIPLYKTAYDYQEAHQRYDCLVRVDTDDEDAMEIFADIKTMCLRSKKKKVKNETLFQLTYYSKDERDIRDVIIRWAPYVLPMPGSRLYEEIKQMKENLDTIFPREA